MLLVQQQADCKHVRLVSLCIFVHIAYSETIMGETAIKYVGIKVNGEGICSIVFAEDQTIHYRKVSDSTKTAQQDK